MGGDVMMGAAAGTGGWVGVNNRGEVNLLQAVCEISLGWGILCRVLTPYNIVVSILG